MKKHIISVVAVISSSMFLVPNVFAEGQLGQSNEASQSLQQTSNKMMSESQAKAAVEKELGTYSKDVTVMIKNNSVYLIGKLPSDTSYEQVVTRAESIKGIDDINVDGLTVKDSQQPLKDTYLTAKVKGALIKHDLFGKDIPSWTVYVETKNGVVYLSGSIDSEKDKLAVLNVVKDIKDVKEVEDKMTISNDDQ